MIGVVKRAQVPFFQNVLLGRLDIDPFRTVNRGIGIADADDFDTAFVSERQRSDRTNIAEPLHDRGTFFGIDL